MKKTLFLPLITVCVAMQLSIGTANAVSSVAASILKSRHILAEKGNVDAQFKLASMYELGIGTDIDLDKAGYWYSESANKGFMDSQKRLKYLDAKKNGFSKDAHGDWLKKLKADAKKGSSQSLMILGQLHSYGLGVKKDLERAFKMLNRADLTNPVILFEMERIEEELDKAEAKQRKKTAKKEKSTAKKASKKKSVDKTKVAKKKVLTKKQRRKRYDAMMAKIREEERILEEEQAWAEGRTVKKETRRDTQVVKSRSFNEMMRKLKEEERILAEEQAWAESGDQ